MSGSEMVDWLVAGLAWAGMVFNFWGLWLALRRAAAPWPWMASSTCFALALLVVVL
jgi:hypothetical protein